MKKVFNILIILAVLSTPHLVVQAYQQRGYFAIGGEWLRVLVVLLAYALAIQFKFLLRGCFKDDGNH